ncbi:unnamed protein product [Effrenium voratum]|uniref:Uncharacterized protein n=1 Tax=Effrenium voratum TaxID=2562239 RepID=A0AA36N8Q8_9DINO|nr:unnamed protein product [Effrenium voratum]
MGKRAAQPSEKAQAKVAKVEAAPVDPFMQDLAPLLTQLQRAEAAEILGASAAEMLRAVAPFCLKTPQAERHPYQAQMVDSLESTLQKLQAAEEAAVAGAENGLTEAKQEQDTCAMQLEAAAAKAEERKQELETKESVRSEMEAEAATAVQKAREAQEQEQQLGKEKAAALEEKDSALKFATTWDALKNGTFAGKEWRERNKAIDETLKVMGGIGLDASLKASLPTALRTKPAERQRFSLKAVEFCEVALESHRGKLEEKINGFDEEAAARAKTREQAQEVLAGVEERLAGAKAEAASSQEALEVSLAEKAAVEQATKAAPAREAALQSNLAEAREALARTQGALAEFQGLKALSVAPAKAEAGSVAAE